MESIPQIECFKCHHKIPSSNKKLHELQCKGIPEQLSTPSNKNK